MSDLVIQLHGFDVLQDRLAALGNPQLDQLFKQLGKTQRGEDQTRIRKEKESPDDVPWTPWSAAYAKTRKRGQSILRSTGALLKSIDFDVEADGVRVGSPLIYAKSQQEGRGRRPARPFLGVSEDNARELGDVVERYYERLLGVAS